MSFHPPFKDKFEDGDLVYGLSNERDLYARNFAHFKSSLTPTNTSTIVQYAEIKVEILFQERLKKTTPVNQDEYLRVLSSHPKYRMICDIAGYNKNHNNLYPHQVVGRKCKAALFLVSNPPDKTSINFILDRIDMSLVVEKSSPPDNKERAFTGVELRWIYRHRYPPLVMQKIQFWLKGLPTTPPWIGENSGLWQQYIPASDPDWSASLSKLFHLS